MSSNQYPPAKTYKEALGLTQENLTILKQFIKRLIYHFGLNTRLDDVEVLNELVTRHGTADKSGKPVENMLAWQRRVAMNYIREFKRKHDRVDLCDPNTLETQSSHEEETNLYDPTIYLDKDIGIHPRWLRESIRCLSDSEQQLIELKYLQGKSWEDVRIIMSAQDKSDLPTLEALRQRGMQARRALRKLVLEKLQSMETTSQES